MEIVRLINLQMRIINIMRLNPKKINIDKTKY